MAVGEDARSVDKLCFDGGFLIVLVGAGTPASMTAGIALLVAHATFKASLFLVVGIVVGVLLHPEVPVSLQPYLPIAVVAALDAVFGGLRAVLDGIFDDKVFVVSFLSNAVVAALIVYLGDQLGVGAQLTTGVVVVLGIRIFSNVAAIRRHVFHA